MAEKEEIKDNYVEVDLSLSNGLKPFNFPYSADKINKISEMKAVVPSSTVEDGSLDLGIFYQRTYNILEELEQIYFEDPIINACVSIIASSVIDDGVRIVGGDEKYREFIIEFLDFMKIEDVFYNAASLMNIYGEAYIEIIYKRKDKDGSFSDVDIGDKNRFKKEISGIRVINPKNMLIVRDSLGKFIKYKLTKGGTKTIAYAQVATDVATSFGYTINSVKDIERLTNYEGAYVLFEPDEMIHLKMGELGDTGYGLSPMYSLRNLSYQRRRIESDAVGLIHFYAQPIYIFKLGDEKQGIPANSKDISSFVTKLNSRQPDEHLVTNIFVQAETLGAFDKALDPVPLTEYMREQTGLGMGVPSTLIGATSKGAFGGGVVQTQERVFYQKVRKIQKTLRYVMRSKLFPLICYYQDTDLRKRGVREGDDKRNITSEHEMMFSIEFMRKIPDMIFNPIEHVLDKHKRVVEQFAAGLLTQEAAQSAIGIKPEEVEEGEYFHDITADKEWETIAKELALQHKQAKELVKVEAQYAPAPTSPTSSASKTATGTKKSPRGTTKPATSTRAPQRTEPVGTGIGVKGKKVTKKKISRKPKGA